MSKNNYNNFYNQNKPAETPNTPAEENKELETPILEGDAPESPEGTLVVPAADENVDPELPENNEEETEESKGNENTDDADNEDNEDESEDETDEDETETHNVQKVRVTVNSLNIRNAADKDSDIVTVVKKDDLLELRESTSVDGFYAVKTNNGTFGYCMEDFVELV